MCYFIMYTKVQIVICSSKILRPFLVEFGGNYPKKGLLVILTSWYSCPCWPLPHQIRLIYNPRDIIDVMVYDIQVLVRKSITTSGFPLGLLALGEADQHRCLCMYFHLISGDIFISTILLYLFIIGTTNFFLTKYLLQKIMVTITHLVL